MDVLMTGVTVMADLDPIIRVSFDGWESIVILFKKVVDGTSIGVIVPLLGFASTEKAFANHFHAPLGEPFCQAR
ncbi:MAG TPA: hypothetical protein VL727_29125, partial [Puia sp.]|nr:hypothetical protein [Puia sp.]